MICFREVFLQKAIIHLVLPNIFFKVLPMFVMFIILLIFGNEKESYREKSYTGSDWIKGLQK